MSANSANSNSNGHKMTPDTTKKKPTTSLTNWKLLLKKRIFILSWIQNYDVDMMVGDFIAGTTLGLTMIPQAIAYAAILGLPPQYGLYSAFMGTFVYAFLGTVKEISMGPTGILSLLSLQYTMGYPVEYTIMLTFMSGLVVFLMGALNLGILADFISVPVTNAFSSATLIIISSTQLKTILGISYSSKGFVDSLHNLLLKITETRLWDTVLGVTCCIVLILFRKLKDVNVKSTTRTGKMFKKCLWYLSQAGSMLVIIITSIVAFQWVAETNPFKLLGSVPQGIPNITVPPFQFEHQNKTIGFLDICKDLGSGLFIVPLVAVSANIAIAKTFSSAATLDATQEMLTLGICNVIGSFVGSMPTCGAITRTAISQASGVRTPLAGIYTSIMTLLALSVLTPYFYFIPQVSLAAILIVACIFAIDFSLPLYLWRNSRKDFWSWLVCLVTCLFGGIEVGLFVGVTLNISQLLYLWARPGTVIEEEEINNTRFIRVKPNIGIFYPGIVHLRDEVNKALLLAQFKVPVVIECGRFAGLDYTAAQGICGLANDLKKHSQVLVLKQLKEKFHNLITSPNVVLCETEECFKVMICHENISTESAIIPRSVTVELDEDTQPKRGSVLRRPSCRSC
ncbi:sodium-independent sulfate anion transporter-like isoform X1 [Bradysia coprophila]|uniref:sodium-independent sulfate anion transporter-like isoform X1 n=2 Tax=Bradysia coprophila TaxID=38358 RepID=UPI00187D726C|nr:sodium-independent sulfate anion transporter-like isoform X1 [Bradysia coprophila]